MKQTSYFVLMIAALFLSLPLQAQQKKKLAEMPKPAAAKPRPAPAVAKKTVKILPDADCVIKVDGEERARAKAGEVTRIYLGKGTYLLQFVSLADKSVKSERDYTVTSTDSEELLRISLTGNAPTPGGGIEKITDPLTGTFILVRGGTFKMGCTSDQSDCVADEKPTHSVTLSNFYLGETEVTQAQWRAVMGSNAPELGFPGCDQCPVEGVSWNDIQDFLTRLNSRNGGVQYRLPTEAEWEYAARGGNQSRGYQYAGSNNLDEVGYYYNNSGDRYLGGFWDVNNLSSNNCKTRPVKNMGRNELGLYDMSGNVWEWCSDWYGSYSGGSQMNPAGPVAGSNRVVRGGSWRHDPARCRVAYRNYNTPGYRSNNLGFRLARTP